MEKRLIALCLTAAMLTVCMPVTVGAISTDQEKVEIVYGAEEEKSIEKNMSESKLVKISEIPDMQMLLHLMLYVRASYGQEVYTCDYKEQGVNVIHNIVCNPQTICFRDYDIEQPVTFLNFEEEDPRGYLNGQYSGLECRKIPEKSVVWIAENILHQTPEAIDSWTKKEDMFYYEDGYYYGFIGGIGSPFYITEAVGAKRMGDKYCIYYNYIPDPKACAGMDTEAMGMTSRGFALEAAYMNVDGHDYWTIYREEELGHEITPEEIYGDEASKYSDMSGLYDWELIGPGRHFSN